MDAVHTLMYDIQNAFNNKNMTLYVKYLKQACKLNDPLSFLHLGNYYFDINDELQAVNFWIKGCKLGNYESSYNLGKYYQENKQEELMLTYYTIAIEQGDCESSYNLAEYYKSKNSDINIIMNYYNIGSARGHFNSIYKCKELLSSLI